MNLKKNNYIMGLKCIFKGHKWQKVGGTSHIGKGKFRQSLICKTCGKRIVKIS